MQERRCSTARVFLSGASHVGMPSWLVPGTFGFQRRVRRVGYREVMRERQAYLDGFVDARGNWWCGECYYHALLINLGEQLGYPAWSDVGLEAGYDQWLLFARQAGRVAVGDAVRFVRLAVSEE